MNLLRYFIKSKAGRDKWYEITREKVIPYLLNSEASIYEACEAFNHIMKKRSPFVAGNAKVKTTVNKEVFK